MFKRGAVLALSLMGGLLFNTVAIQPVQAANEISRLVPFQGRLHGTDNKAVSDGVYDITFNIYDTPTGGTPSWTESHTQVSVIHGYVNVLLGAINAMHDVNYANVTATPAYDASKNNVDFTTKKFLGISIDGGVEMFPRSQLVPSFHAYTANHADHATQADNADNLGNKAASTYAQVSYVNTQDDVLDARITSEVASINSTSSSIASRTKTLESRFTGTKANNAEKLDGLNYDYFATQADMVAVQSRFTGNVANEAQDANTLDNKDSTHFATASSLATTNGKIASLESKFTGEKASLAVSSDSASNADKLDNINSSSFARTDVAETFSQPVTINNSLSANSISSTGSIFGSIASVSGEMTVGGDLIVGKDGANDSVINMYDDLNNQPRSIQWAQSERSFQFEDVSGNFHPFLQVRSGSIGVGDAAVTIPFTEFPNDVIWVGAYSINAGKYAIAPSSFVNGSLVIDRNNDFGGTHTIKWFAIGY